MKPLDTGLRARLHELARSEGEGLDASARRRVVTHARASRAAAQKRALVVPVFAAAALVAFAVLSDGGRAPVSVAPREPARIAEDAPVAVVPRQPEPPPCAREPLPEVREVERRGARSIDLGERARFILSRRGAGTLAEVTRCRTVLALTEGSVAVHARDLAGGQLIVRARGTDVVVHGTVFEVAVGGPSGGRVEVTVAEGVVDVARGTELARVSAGSGVRLDGDAVRPFRIGQDRIAGLLDRVTERGASRLPSRPGATAAPVRGEVTEGVPEVHRPRISSP